MVPHAELVATEDLGYTHSTPLLRYQAAFENERRWLTFDLLNGRVDRHHPLWSYLCRVAPMRSRLLEIADAAADKPLRPAIHGINHYLTSERFLDTTRRHYPRAHVGRQRRASLRRRRGGARAARRAARAAAHHRAGVPPIRHAGRGNRGASRMHARAADALAARGVDGRDSLRARAGTTCAR